MLKKLALFACFSSFFILAGCNKLTQENYNKLEMGMERTQVESLFGKPAECQAALKITSCSWQEGDASLQVQFVDNKVITYFGNKIK